MKKILILSASPRKAGNSDLLCDQFMKGAVESGNQAEKIFLRNKKINYCVGCGMCVGRKGSCSQQDDMQEIAQKMIEADVLVLATPVYFYTMDAQMKTLIDRCCAFYTAMKQKEIYFIVTAADSDKAAMECTLDGMRGFVTCLDNAHEKETIYGIGAWEKGAIVGMPAMEEAYETGKKV